MSAKKRAAIEIVVQEGTKLHGNSKPVELIFYAPKGGWNSSNVNDKASYTPHSIIVKPPVLKALRDAFVSRKDKRLQEVALSGTITMNLEIIYNAITRLKFSSDGSDDFVPFTAKFNVKGMTSTIAALVDAIEHIESGSEGGITTSSFDSVEIDSVEETKGMVEVNTIEEISGFQLYLENGGEIRFGVDVANPSVVIGNFTTAGGSTSSTFTGYEMIMFRRALKLLQIHPIPFSDNGTNWALRSVSEGSYIMEFNGMVTSITLDDIDRLIMVVKVLINARYSELGLPIITIDTDSDYVSQPVPLKSAQHFKLEIVNDELYIQAGLFQLVPTEDQLNDIIGLLKGDFDNLEVARIITVAPNNSVAVTYRDTDSLILSVVSHGSTSVPSSEFNLHLTSEEVATVVSYLEEMALHAWFGSVKYPEPADDTEEEIEVEEYENLNPPGSKLYNSGNAIYFVEPIGFGSHLFMMAGSTNRIGLADDDMDSGSTVMTAFTAADHIDWEYLISILGECEPGNSTTYMFGGDARKYATDDEGPTITVEWLRGADGTARITCRQPGSRPVIDILYASEREELIEYIKRRIEIVVDTKPYAPVPDDSGVPASLFPDQRNTPKRSDDEQIFYVQRGLSELVKGVSGETKDLFIPSTYTESREEILNGAARELGNTTTDELQILRLFNSSRFLNIVFISILEAVEKQVNWGSEFEISELIPNASELLSTPEKASILSRIFAEANRQGSMIETCGMFDNKLRKIKSLVVIKDTPDDTSLEPIFSPDDTAAKIKAELKKLKKMAKDMDKYKEKLKKKGEKKGKKKD